MKKQLLTLVALVLNTVCVLAQGQDSDTNKVRFAALFQEMHDKITWGMPATNGVQLGVSMVQKDDDKWVKFETYTYLYVETNFWFGLYPPNDYRLALSLKDATGKEIEKTKEGESITKQVGFFARTKMKLRTNRTQGRFDLLPQKVPTRYEKPFNLLNCFKLEKPGTNTLTIKTVLFMLNDESHIQEIAVPPISIQVSITQLDLDNYRISHKPD